MKPPLAKPDRTTIRKTDRRKAFMLTRAIEETVATLTQHMAETGHSEGRFYWDGMAGDFSSTTLVTALDLACPEGLMSVSCRLRNDEWTHVVAVSLPDHALKATFEKLHSLMGAVNFGSLEVVKVSVR